MKTKMHKNDIALFVTSDIIHACEANGIPKEATDELIREAVKQFSINADGSVIPTGGYSSIDDFVTANRDRKPSEDSTAPTMKDRLFTKMCKYAEQGDVKAYKACRLEYMKA